MPTPVHRPEPAGLVKPGTSTSRGGWRRETPPRRRPNDLLGTDPRPLFPISPRVLHPGSRGFSTIDMWKTVARVGATGPTPGTAASGPPNSLGGSADAGTGSRRVTRGDHRATTTSPARPSRAPRSRPTSSSHGRGPRPDRVALRWAAATACGRAHLRRVRRRRRRASPPRSASSASSPGVRVVLLMRQPARVPRRRRRRPCSPAAPRSRSTTRRRPSRSGTSPRHCGARGRDRRGRRVPRLGLLEVRADLPDLAARDRRSTSPTPVRRPGVLRVGRAARRRARRSRARRGRGAPRRPRDRHLHVGHDRRPEGRDARPRQRLLDPGEPAARARLLHRGLPGRLVPPDGAHRRAHGEPLQRPHARLRDHRVPRPASRARRVPADPAHSCSSACRAPTSGSTAGCGRCSPADPDNEARFDRALVDRPAGRGRACRSGGEPVGAARTTEWEQVDAETLRPVRELLGLADVRVRGHRGGADAGRDPRVLPRAGRAALGDVRAVGVVGAGHVGAAVRPAGHRRSRRSRAWSCASPTTAR